MRRARKKDMRLPLQEGKQTVACEDRTHGERACRHHQAYQPQLI